MIVVIHKPDSKKGYYGNVVAAPVFETLAQYIYGKTPREVEVAITDFKNSKTEKIVEKYKTVMPDLRGLPAKDALYILENMGLKVKMNGSGRVVSQSIPRGTRIKRRQEVTLKMS